MYEVSFLISSANPASDAQADAGQQAEQPGVQLGALHCGTGQQAAGQAGQQSASTQKRAMNA